MKHRADSGTAMHSDAEVLIVGAGPVGLTLALLLARRGRTVAVYERWTSAYPLPRAAAMSHETVRTFQAAGVLAQLRPHLNVDLEKLSTSLLAADGEVLAADGEVLATMAFPGQGVSGFPPMVNFHPPSRGTSRATASRSPRAARSSSAATARTAPSAR